MPTRGVAAHLQLRQLAGEPRAFFRGRKSPLLESLLLHSLACEQRVQSLVLLCHATLLRLHLQCMGGPAACSAWGCSLDCMGLQPAVHGAAAWIARGCSLPLSGRGLKVGVRARLRNQSRVRRGEQ